MAGFDYFVIIAGMRTGSNLLEETLSRHDRLSCHGELFNPHFVGGPNRESALGISRQSRDADPLGLLMAVKAAPGLAGFRLFDGHDDRILDHVLADPHCAKIVLTRNPAESYVSLKIARQTGQWWMGDAARARPGRASFDAAEFHAFLADLDGFRQRVRLGLQRAGETSFDITYDAVSDPEVIAGLFRYLGVDPIAPPKVPRGKVQNPAPLLDKLDNPDAMRAALGRLDPFELDRIPDFEPARNAGARRILVADEARLMAVPVAGLAHGPLTDWMQAAEGAPPRSDLNQRELRRWMRETPGHRAIACVAHPLRRAFEVYAHRIESGRDADLRRLLVRDYGLPEDGADPRAGLLAFLDYARATLHGQTGHRVDPDLASQLSLIQGLSSLRPPDRIIRIEDFAPSMAEEARALSRDPPRDTVTPAADSRLADIHDAALEKAARAAYRRDYAFLGYGDFDA